MDKLDKREWLLTNGLGSFASGTVCDAHTRTYHGWLIAALEPPGQRTLLLSRIDASLDIQGQMFDLGTNFWTSGAIAPKGYQFLQDFQVDPVPTWVWGWNDWQLRRRLIMPYGLVSSTQASELPQFHHSVLVDYRYDGTQPATLNLRPLVGDRIFHYQQHADPDLEFVQLIESQRILLQAKSPAWMGTCWQLSWSQGRYQPDGMWYWGYHYPEETERGLSDREDLYTPGVLTVTLNPGDTIALEAAVRNPEGLLPYTLDAKTLDRAIVAEQERLRAVFGGVEVKVERSKSKDQSLEVGDQGVEMESAELNSQAFNPNRQSPLTVRGASPKANPPSPTPDLSSLSFRLLKASDQFLVYRASINGPTVIAGYPWFNDWGRDTLIALPGLTLTSKRYDLAKGLLKTLGQYCQQGLIPNAFPDAGTQPFYNSIDAALWWIETLGLYVEASGDWAFLVEQYPIVGRIYKGLMAGTWYNIRVDASDGLVTWDAPNVALTWMDAVVKQEPVTPRLGKAVEINALWYSALCWAAKWAIQLQQQPEMDTTALANQARRYQSQVEQVKLSLQKFWNPAQSYLFDTIAPDDYPNGSIRPNAVIALSLYHCGFSDFIGQQVLQVARDRLLTPYGLRSLDPADPSYVGKYVGGIWQRDRAYHQGSVWSWLIGPFIRAWQRFYPEQPVPFDWQPLIEHFEQQACFGSMSEIFDGDSPHLPRGAIAQAWSVAEMIRHWRTED